MTDTGLISCLVRGRFIQQRVERQPLITMAKIRNPTRVCVFILLLAYIISYLCYLYYELFSSRCGAGGVVNILFASEPSSIVSREYIPFQATYWHTKRTLSFLNQDRLIAPTYFIQYYIYYCFQDDKRNNGQADL